MATPATSALAHDLACRLAAELNGSYDSFEQAMQCVLQAVTNGSECDDADWDAVSVIVSLPVDGQYEPHPDSASAVRAAGVRLLAALGRTVTSVGSNGQDVRLAWDVSYGFVAAMRTAYVDLGLALEALEADAGQLVSA